MNRIWKMVERISGIETKIEEMGISVKESEKIQAQNIQEFWDTMNIPNLLIIGIEEGEETQVRGTENIFSKITEEKIFKSKESDLH